MAKNPVRLSKTSGWFYENLIDYIYLHGASQQEGIKVGRGYVSFLLLTPLQACYSDP